jgi:hypothetical protein
VITPQPRSPWWVETPDGGVRPATMEETTPLFGSLAGNDARRVARDEEPGVGVVSTVFLAMDHNWNPDPNAAPILYESMFFPAEGDEEYQRRYYTRAEALAGHAEMCRECLGRDPL